MSHARPPLWLRWLTAASVLVMFPVAGLLAGGVVATRLVTVSGMGWDQLATLLGGLQIGGIAGFALGVVAVRLLGPRDRLVATGVAVIGCVAAVLYLLATPPNVRRRAVTVTAPPSWSTGSSYPVQRPD